MMLRGEANLLHAGILRELDPLLGIKMLRVPLLCQLLILRNWNLGAIHNPFAQAWNLFALPLASGNRVKAPMDEHAVLRLLEPRQPGLSCFRRIGSCRAS